MLRTLKVHLKATQRAAAYKPKSAWWVSWSRLWLRLFPVAINATQEARFNFPLTPSFLLMLMPPGLSNSPHSAASRYQRDRLLPGGPSARLTSVWLRSGLFYLFIFWRYVRQLKPHGTSTLARFCPCWSCKSDSDDTSHTLHSLCEAFFFFFSLSAHSPLEQVCAQYWLLSGWHASLLPLISDSNNKHIGSLRRLHQRGGTGNEKAK